MDHDDTAGASCDFSGDNRGREESYVSEMGTSMCGPSSSDQTSAPTTSIQRCAEGE